jgi:hypothetical protein
VLRCLCGGGETIWNCIVVTLPESLSSIPLGHLAIPPFRRSAICDASAV